MERSQITGSVPDEFATNAMARPSGDRANWGTGTVMFIGPEKNVFSGESTENRTVSPAAGARKRSAAKNASVQRSRNASIQAARSRHGLCFTAEEAPAPSPSAIHFRF